MRPRAFWKHNEVLLAVLRGDARQLTLVKTIAQRIRTAEKNQPIRMIFIELVDLNYHIGHDINEWLDICAYSYTHENPACSRTVPESTG